MITLTIEQILISLVVYESVKYMLKLIIKFAIKEIKYSGRFRISLRNKD